MNEIRRRKEREEMTDKEKLRESMAYLESIADVMEAEGLDHDDNARHYSAGAYAIKSHLSTLDEVSKEDATTALSEFDRTLLLETEGDFVDDYFSDATIETIRTLLRAAAGVK